MSEMPCRSKILMSSAFLSSALLAANATSVRESTWSATAGSLLVCDAFSLLGLSTLAMNQPIPTARRIRVDGLACAEQIRECVVIGAAAGEVEIDPGGLADVGQVVGVAPARLDRVGDEQDLVVEGHALAAQRVVGDRRKQPLVGHPERLARHAGPDGPVQAGHR